MSTEGGGGGTGSTTNGGGGGGGGGAAPTSVHSTAVGVSSDTSVAPPTTPTPVQPTTTTTPANPPTTTTPAGGGGAGTVTGGGGVPTTATSTAVAPTQPASTQLITSVITEHPTSTAPDGATLAPSTTVIVITSTPSESTTALGGGSTTLPPSASTSGSAAAGHSSGLSAGGKTAVAVVVPIAAVAALILFGLFFYRRRARKRQDEEKRTEEMAAYSYNPNNDPTLPAVGLKDDGTMSDEGMGAVGAPAGGYRGWGPAGSAATGSLGRKTSTNASGTARYSTQGPGSPGPVEVEGEPVGAYAAAGAAGAAAGGLHRGPSNASSTYSHGDEARASADYPPVPYLNQNNGYGPPPGHAQDYNPYGDYYQSGPYDYAQGDPGQPVIRDNPARRLTQIQEGQPHPEHGGISRNF